MTLCVESNFVLELVLGQEEGDAADRLLRAAEGSVDSMAAPSFSLNDVITRVTRGVRYREPFVDELRAFVRQVDRSEPHRQKVDLVQRFPELVASVNARALDRLYQTVDRLLRTAKLIPFDHSAFQHARDLRLRFDPDFSGATIPAVVLAEFRRIPSPRRHVFANRNRRDFSKAGIATVLNGRGCGDLVWGFAEAERRLGVA